VTAASILGFSWASGITEMLTGTWSSITLTMNNYFEKEKDMFGHKHLAKSWEFIMGDAMLNSTTAASENINLCDSINEMYRLVDMDLYHMIEKGQLNYNSGTNFVSKWMYWFSIFPNYFHRLAMFSAQMIKDGILKVDASGFPTKDSAIQYVNEKLVYDESKDDRFSAYLNTKEEPTETEAKRRYLEAKLKYETIKESLIRDGYMKEGEKLTRWYDEKQRNSMVSFAGRALGDYESTLKTTFSKTVLGRAFGLFKTWMYAKKDKYFMKFQENDMNGKYVLQYDEQGNPTYYAWQGRLMEGIFHTLGYIAQSGRHHLFSKEFSPSAFINDMANLQNYQKANLAWLASDLVLMAIIAAIVAAIRGERDSKGNYEGIAKGSFEWTMLGAFDRSVNDLWVWASVQSVAGAYNPFPALGLINNTITGINGALSGDAYKAKRALNSISIYRNYIGPVTSNLSE
jgi:hypothetical protein